MSTTTTPIRAAVYTRVSKLKTGEVYGTERQVPPCQRLVTDLGGQVVEVFEDDEHSAWSGKPRPGYEAMLAAARQGHVNAFVAAHFDRFTRQSKDAATLSDFAQSNGIRLLTAGGPIDLDTATGRKAFRDLASSAEFESDLRSERTRAKHAELRATGQWRGGIRPFGFDLVPSAVLETTRPDGSKVKRLLDCKLEPNPREAELVREAVSRILLGGSLSGIVRDWAQRGVRGSRGGHLNTQRLRTILTGPHLAGLRQNGAGLVEAEWSGIVDRAEWERLVLVLGDPPHKRGPQAPRSYLFGVDLLQCACGGRMTPHPRPGGHRGYQCSSQLGGCGKLRRTAPPLEDHVRDMALQALATPAMRGKLVEQLGDVDATARAQQLIGQRETERARLADLRERLGDGRIDPDDFTPAKEGIVTRVGELDAALAKTTDTSGALIATLPPTFEALQQAWGEWPLDVRRAVLKLVVERVELRGRLSPGTRFQPDQVKIRWRG